MTEYTEEEFLEFNRKYLKRLIAEDRASRALIIELGLRKGMGRSPVPCRLGIHNYRWRHHWVECVCGKVKKSHSADKEFDSVDDLIAWLDE